MASNFRSDVYEGGLVVDPSAGAGVAATIGAILPRVGTTELWQKFGALDTQWQLFTGSASTIFPPTRIAVVDPNRGNDATGVFGGLPFLTITAALAAAPAQTPTAANPTAIWIAPGTYTEAGTVVLVSNCHLSACPNTTGTVTINTALTWNPAVGPNAPQSAAPERVELGGLVLASTVTVVTTAKVGSTTQFDMRDTSFGVETYTGRTDGGDFALLLDCISSDTVSVNNGTFLIKDTDLGLLTISGDGVTLINTTACNATTLTISGGTGTLNFNQSTVTGVTTCAAGGFINGAGSKFATVVATGTVDIRGSTYGQVTDLQGTGPTDRTWYTFAAPPSTIGANTLTFAALFLPPYIDNAYNVIFTPTGTSTGMTAVLGLKSSTGFAYTDTISGQTYDITIIKP